jgi:uncharacterized protein
MTNDGIGLAPVTGRARIDVLDMLRGIAILGIFYMNIPYMAASVGLQMNDLRSIGWTVADRNTWIAIEMFWEGTQRCMLEFLFGAGMMVLTAKAMEPTGPVAIADLYYRRNLWLLLFGFVDIFVLLWVGDILHVYALAALFLFPFRKLGPKALVALGLVWATLIGIGVPEGGAIEYAARTELVRKVEVAQAKQAAGTPITRGDKKALDDWQKRVAKIGKIDKEDQAILDAEKKGMAGGWWPYAEMNWGFWLMIAAKGSVLFGVIEAFSTMLIGIALWKWRVIQGGRSKAFYAGLMLIGYGFGLTARGFGAWEVLQFSPIPKTIWITEEYARIAVTLGHVGLVNLAIKTALGANIFAPFKAAGRTAFSLYFLQQIIAMYILFAPFGLGLWGKYSYGALAGIATAVVIGELILANIWIRYFTNGPLEWAWRSLAYWQRQPFRRRPEAPVAAEVDPGPAPLPA